MDSALKSSGTSFKAAGKIRKRRIRFSDDLTTVTYEKEEEEEVKPESKLNDDRKKESNKEPKSSRINNEVDKKKTRKASDCSMSVVCAWTALTVVMIAVSLTIATSFALNASSVPRELEEAIQRCRSDNIDSCSRQVVHYRAASQILIVDSGIAKEFVPKGINVVSLMGKTAAAVQVMEIVDDSGDLSFQTEVILLATRGHNGYLGSWIIQSFVTSSALFDDLKDLGHNARMLNTYDIDLNCTSEHDKGSINFYNVDNGDNSKKTNDSSEVIINAAKVCLPSSTSDTESEDSLADLRNHSLHYFSGKQGERLYVYEIFTAEVRLTNTLTLKVNSRFGEESKVGRLIESGYYVPYSIVFDKAKASVWKPQAVYDDEAKTWKVVE